MSLLDRSELVTNRKKVKRFFLSRGHIVEVDSLIKFWCTVNSLLDGDLRDGHLVPAPPGGELPYISYTSGCRPPRVGFLRRFGLQTSIHFPHFGLESGMVFEGTTGVYER